MLHVLSAGKEQGRGHVDIDILLLKAVEKGVVEVGNYEGRGKEEPAEKNFAVDFVGVL